MESGWEISAWHVWLLLALVLAVIDLAVVGVSGVLLALAAGALFAMAAALLGFSALPQMLIAAFTGLAMMPVFVWAFRRMTGKQAGNRAADSRLRQELHTVVEAHGKTGIWVLGDFFPVQDMQGRIPATGDRVRVRRFRGITAIVESVSDTAGGQSGSASP